MRFTRRQASWLFTTVLLFPVLAATSQAPPQPDLPQPALVANLQDKPLDPNSAAACGECHTEIYQEWKGKAHHMAWDDPIYQAALKTKKRPKLCYACHIPQSVLDRLGKRPKTRKTLKHEGVTCVSCHQKGNAIHGPFGDKTHSAAAHPVVVKDDAFSFKGSVKLCAGCHNKNIGPVLDLVSDFEGANMAAKGKSCIGCHMPEIERHIAIDKETKKPVGKKRKGRRHSILGPNDIEFVSKAFGLSTKKKDKNVELHIENKAGHKIPGLRIRDFVFFVRQLDEKGKELAKATFKINSDNLLKVQETRVNPYTLKEGAKKLEVRVEHKLNDKLVAEIIKQTFDL